MPSSNRERFPTKSSRTCGPSHTMRQGDRADLGAEDARSSSAADQRNEPQRLSKVPVGTVGCAPLSRLPLLVDLPSVSGASALAVAAGAGAAGAAAGRIAPAFALGSVDLDSACRGSGSDGPFAFAVDAVWVDFAGGLGLRFGVGVVGSGGGSDLIPIRRDMRSHTPP